MRKKKTQKRSRQSCNPDQDWKDLLLLHDCWNEIRNQHGIVNTINAMIHLLAFHQKSIIGLIDEIDQLKAQQSNKIPTKKEVIGNA